MNNVTYFAPETLAEALELLDAHEGARVLAGGTDLIAKWKKSHCFDMKLVDIGRIAELKEIRETTEGLFVGAGVTMTEINESAAIAKKYPILAEAAGRVGSVQVRNMATIGGNVCNAAPSADTVLPLIACNAQTVVCSKTGECKSSLRNFFVGPGKTTLEAGCLFKGLLLPEPAPQTAAFFVKHSRRAGLDLAPVGVAVVLDLDGSGKKLEGIRVVLGAVGPTPIFVKGLEPVFGKDFASKEVGLFVADRAAADASPITDVRGSKEYREEMVRRSVLTCFEGISKA